MNRLSIDRQAQILGMLVEGNSIRATARMANCCINTVTKLLIDVGRVCADYQDRVLRDLPCKRIQVDEVWAFCHTKKKNVTSRSPKGAGNIWTWTSICADTKLVPAFLVGKRGQGDASRFMCDLASRMKGRIQLTSDGYRRYLEAVDDAFGKQVDYGMYIKTYDENNCTGFYNEKIVGMPEEEHMRTSTVERLHLTMRMSMRRFTRQSNGFSKKIENHMHAVALHFLFYNFARIHQTIRVTPAMEAGVSDHVWELGEIINLTEETRNGDTNGYDTMDTKTY